MSSKPSTDSYKGVRDFYPEDQFIQSYIFDVWRNTTQSFGYEEYNASILEPTELYTAKTSEEIIDEQTYTFIDRGKRSVTLRPEMTPSVSRMISHNRRKLTFPLRWFSIGNMFRYERPQRGRLREHWQLNADIFGVGSIEADIEIIQLAHAIMTAFGIPEDVFEIRVNNRGTLRDALVESGLSEKEAEQELTKMDKGKITTKIDTSPGKHTENIISTLKTKGLNNVVYDQNLVRGFSYYTGTVFEVFDISSKNKRSLFGGGRYDKLVGSYDDTDIPAVGFAMGDVTTRDVLETYNLLPKYTPTTQLYICTTEKKYLNEAEHLASLLRNKKLNIEVDISFKKIGEQVGVANKKSIPYIICIGEKEIKEKIYALKNLTTGKETKFNKDNLKDMATVILSEK